MNLHSLFKVLKCKDLAILFVFSVLSGMGLAHIQGFTCMAPFHTQVSEKQRNSLLSMRQGWLVLRGLLGLQWGLCGGPASCMFINDCQWLVHYALPLLLKGPPQNSSPLLFGVYSYVLFLCNRLHLK